MFYDIISVTDIDDNSTFIYGVYKDAPMAIRLVIIIVSFLITKWALYNVILGMFY